MPGTIDTLTIYQRLKSANLKEEAAKEIAEVIKDVAEFQLVTVEYLDKSLEKTKAELMKEIEITRREIEKDIENTRVEIQRSKAEILKWVAGMLVAQAAIVSTLIKLL